MFLENDSTDRSDAYRLLAGLFSRAQTDDELEVIKTDLELKSKDTADQIAADFNLLLRLPDGKLPPVESLYGETRDINVAESVSEFYGRAGLTIGGEFDAPSDHLSLELLFISYLVDLKEMGLVENFLDEHIMNWVPYYCEELKREARTVFYREVADITRNFLQVESDTVG